MKKFLLSSVALGLALSMAVPAFARIADDSTVRIPTRLLGEKAPGQTVFRPVRRQLESSVRSAFARQKKQNVSSTEVTPQEKTYTLLNRSIKRVKQNDTVKPGSDRYRTLNRPNTRYLRKLVEEESMLPPVIVKTGAEQGVLRPGRRFLRSMVNSWMGGQ
ncbi:MAG: hypothetical protein V1926_05630 [Candidatus Peregrinibacteria bacterium]